jgi:Cu/Ag efflux pump CusA
MVAWLIDSAMRLRRLVVAAVVAVLGLGLVQLQHAPVDVYPEFEGTRVEVQAEALGLSAQEVEQLITVPIEQDLLNGVPWLKSITSRSMPGLSAIDLTFEPGTDLYRARQMVQERMSQAKALPNVGTPPAVIQPTSSTSRVEMVGLRSSSASLIEMSVLARWQIRPRLMSIPGVAQVSIFGQQDRQLQVQVDPQRLQATNVTLTQLIETTGNALWVSPLSFVEASTPGTGGFIETPNQRLGVQHVSPITSADQLADVAVQGVQGAAVRLRDVTTVVEDHQKLIGDATDAGRPSLMLVVERFPGANTAQVTHDVDEALASMRPGLKGITVDTSVYRPLSYLESALHRIGIAALIGFVLLGLVIGLLTRSWRVPAIALASTATSVTAALWVLYLSGQTLTTMTLLGLAAVMALIIDDALGDTLDLRSRLRARKDAGQSAVTAVLTEAVSSRRAPLTVATAVTLLALLPLVLLTGPAGALVRPSILAFALALLAALLMAVVVTPMLAVMLLAGPRAARRHAGSGPVWARRRLDALADRSGGRALPAVVVLAVLALLALPAIVLLNPGRALPTAQDRNVVVRLQAAPGTALAETNRITSLAAAELNRLPGVRTAGTHVGRAIASDRLTDVDTSEIWLTLAGNADYTGTLDAVRSTVQRYPGLRSQVATYADDQLAAAGTTTGDQMVVRVYGQDLGVLRSTAEDVRQKIQTVPGVLSPTVQPQVTEPAIDIQVDLAAAQRVGLRPGDVRRDAATLVSGLTVGSLYEQQAIFDVVVWGGAATRQSVAGLQSLLIDTPDGGRVRLGDVAQVRVAPEPSAITHDAVSRSLDITAQVRGRSAAAVAADVTTELRRMDFPYEYRAEVVGDAVSRADTYRWIVITAVAVGLLAYLLLQSATASWRGAAVLLLVAPFAAVGALLGAQLTGGVLTGGVLAALFTVVALTLRQGLALVRRAQTLHQDDVATAEAMRRALREKAPVVVGVALATAALFLPAAVMGGGAGLELLQPFAISLLLGLVTAAAVVLLVIPSLYPALAGLRRAPIELDADDAADAGPDLRQPEARTDEARTDPAPPDEIRPDATAGRHGNQMLGNQKEGER